MTRPLYLVTGSTGFLGREFLVRLLATQRPVLLATRRRGEETSGAARQRLAEIVEETEPGTPFGHADVVFGDVSEPGLGLDPKLLDQLTSGDQPVQLIHGAAEVRFDLPWEVMHRQNVLGAENILALGRRLADAGRLARIDYVSTAFIAGTRTGLVREDEIDVGQDTRNDYERSKLVGELAVDRARRAGLPIAVYRPSIIVGDSRTGRASSFKVLYWPLKLYAHGQWRTIFGRADCTVDVVPVDFVADAMLRLLDDERAIGTTIHLAAGPEKQSTIGELVHIVERRFKRGSVRYLDPDLYFKYLRPMLRPLIKLTRPDIAEKGRLYLPYLKSNPSFAVERADSLLAPLGIEAPPLPRYFETIMRYAEETDFGRHGR